MPKPYDVDYESEAFQNVENEEQETLTDLENQYNGMVDQSNAAYEGAIAQSQQWAQEQSQLQQEQTDFAIDQIEQNMDQAEQDYIKEQSGAYADWQKQSNQYGVNAEQMAASGLSKTGFAESSQVRMYNAYQNRVAVGRETFNRAMLNYQNAITQAELQNNAALAEIANTALQQQIELAIQQAQYNNSLMQQYWNQQFSIQQFYYGQWQDVLAQQNFENQMELQWAQFNRQKSGRSGGSGGNDPNDTYVVNKPPDSPHTGAAFNGMTNAAITAAGANAIKNGQVPAGGQAAKENPFTERYERARRLAGF